jgi:signal transduction histidine kinase
MTELARLRAAERWIALIRLGAVGFAVFEVGLLSSDYPAGYEVRAWATTAVLAVGAVVLFLLSRRSLAPRLQRALGAGALAFDTAVIVAYMAIFSFEPGVQSWGLLDLVVVEAALRYGIVGGVGIAIAMLPVLAALEEFRSERFAPREYDLDFVILPVGLGVMIGLIVGWLVIGLRRESERAIERAAEAEGLRDQLGRRVDVLEAANRAARALGSSLELEEAFNAFIREVRGLLPFERIAIVLVENGSARVIATAGAGADDVFPPGSMRPVEGSVLPDVLAGQVVYREDMSEARHPEEQELLALGLHCRLVAPLLLGARSVGMISLVRAAPRSFSAEEIELVSLLGRLVATGVQNIRAYELERSTVEELRRLSALRADFVSLVSHELRSPMAAVIGSARTLQQRWRELGPDQRESFLELIAGETTRLAALIGDVLDTSRIEAGTFSYAFSDVDVGRLVRDTVAAAAVGQDEVELVQSIPGPLPRVRGDRERLRQVLTNLIDNAVKYSPAGGAVRVTAQASSGKVLVEVADAGPGIAREHQGVIFEKFGRAPGDGGSKPGTGLGLFIARSIAEAHGGALDVRSAPARGATFTLTLPAMG